MFNYPVSILTCHFLSIIRHSMPLKKSSSNYFGNFVFSGHNNCFSETVEHLLKSRIISLILRTHLKLERQE